MESGWPPQEPSERSSIRKPTKLHCCRAEHTARSYLRHAPRRSDASITVRPKRDQNDGNPTWGLEKKAMTISMISLMMMIMGRHYHY